ncbi:MAG TPA: hypothetical protein VHX37_13605 [Acidobacteriaceae bacterium]|jgi:hypothetical protein|nr:hypothetical protein [Acidobacteriaceae bacterium]
MQANAYSPYALKDLHQAIDLIDRKITYCNTWETFESQEAREVHLRKLSTKRAALVKSALALAALGVRCDPQFLPRSFIHPVGEEANSVAAAPAVAEAAKATKPPRPPRKRR